jgi:hypothetical protein
MADLTRAVLLNEAIEMRRVHLGFDQMHGFNL